MSAHETTSTTAATAAANTAQVTQTYALAGLLDGLAAGRLLSWGLLDVLSLFPAGEPTNRARFVSPMEHLKLVNVPTYGTVVLRNTATQGVLIVPMHIGFFQDGAQNHATSHVLVLEAGELFEAADCFCIQASQGGLLKEAQQRFLMLPLGLRRGALEQRKSTGYSRLWEDIERFSRRYGISRGGHLERFLRPYFSRLVPLRHALEAQPGQVGAAYFIAGQLAGVEVAPTAEYWQDLFPVLSIYCYGPAALMAERRHWTAQREPIDLEGLRDLDDLEQRLGETRHREQHVRIEELTSLAASSWDFEVEEERHGLRVLTAVQGDWSGQVVRTGEEAVSLSLFRDVTLQPAG